MPPPPRDSHLTGQQEVVSNISTPCAHVDYTNDIHEGGGGSQGGGGGFKLHAMFQFPIVVVYGALFRQLVKSVVTGVFNVARCVV